MLRGRAAEISLRLESETAALLWVPLRPAGQPDRLVRFCCNDCLDDFQKTPAKFLAMIDTAKAKK